ncbi:M23 family metallopeptidase [Aeromicrobium phragmitis]|uniref:M23 family metallopeptidase n=1 Tax=Aeromicrobium phragmitis TaxID=2478914 RepID=A0A3L8PHS2_9ACTN|nr:M23 family metallopeptidase [Aeromicrobium phragmitis]RLV54835.1 M23 family metallopeptidase [Aeromicrobium phragmitis]
MVNPVPGSQRTARFRQQGSHWSLGWHTGEDFAAPVGTPILSCTPGTVKRLVDNDRSYGNYLVIDWNGREIWYCHMPAGAPRPAPGTAVAANQRIGSVGGTGNVTGPHLHLEMRKAPYGFNANDIIDPNEAVNYNPQEDELTPEQAALLQKLSDRQDHMFNMLSTVGSRTYTIGQIGNKLSDRQDHMFTMLSTVGSRTYATMEDVRELLARTAPETSVDTEALATEIVGSLDPASAHAVATRVSEKLNSFEIEGPANQ